MMIDKKLEFEKLIRSKEFFDYSYSEVPTTGPSLHDFNGDKVRTTPSTSDYLVAFSTCSNSYGVGYVDIVNSTKISASLPPNKLSQYYEIFLNSMSKIIENFKGKVIKNIGDCLLYYFPNSVNSSKIGLTAFMDCGLAMLDAQIIISEEMISKKLPKISYRISADYGTVVLMNTSISPTVDLIGPPVNMCAKINNCARPNEFVIGSDLHQYTKKIFGYNFEEIQSYDAGFRHSYPVYKVTSSNR